MLARNRIQAPPNYAHAAQQAWCIFNLLSIGIMATESTEGHGKVSGNCFIFPCSSVDSVAIQKYRHMA
jgi:hypothetical protein